MGIKKGIRIGSAKDGTVTAFIEDMEPTTPDHSGAEGVGVDAQGNVYGARRPAPDARAAREEMSRRPQEGGASTSVKLWASTRVKLWGHPLLGVAYTNPSRCGAKFARFGKIRSRSSLDTPNHPPSVAAY